MEVRILPLGGMDFPKHRLVRCQDPEEMLFSLAWAVLIRHPTLGNVLYDTGHSPAFLQGEMQRVLYDYPVRGIVPIQKALAQVGLTPTSTLTTPGAWRPLRAPRPSATSWWPRPT